MTSGKTVTVDVIDKAAEKLAAEMDKRKIGKGELEIYTELAAIYYSLTAERRRQMENDKDIAPLLHFMDAADTLSCGVEDYAKTHGTSSYGFGTVNAMHTLHRIARKICDKPLAQRDTALAWLRNGDGVTK